MKTDKSLPKAATSKVDQIRALREARASRRENPFEDAARGRDPRAKPEPKQASTKTRSPEAGRYETAGSRLRAGRTAQAAGDKRDDPAAPIRAKQGRPRIGEHRDKPWQALGMSERTYYRRKKEGGK